LRNRPWSLSGRFRLRYSEGTSIEARLPGRVFVSHIAARYLLPYAPAIVYIFQASKRLLALFSVIFLLIVATGCSDGVEGTYQNMSGITVLELRSGGEARLQMMGTTIAGTYEAEDGEVVLTFDERRIVLRREENRLTNGLLVLNRQDE